MMTTKRKVNINAAALKCHYSPSKGVHKVGYFCFVLLCGDTDYVCIVPSYKDAILYRREDFGKIRAVAQRYAKELSMSDFQFVYE